MQFISLLNLLTIKICIYKWNIIHSNAPDCCMKMTRYLIHILWHLNIIFYSKVSLSFYVLRCKKHKNKREILYFVCVLLVAQTFKLVIRKAGFFSKFKYNFLTVKIFNKDLYFFAPQNPSVGLSNIVSTKDLLYLWLYHLWIWNIAD